MFGCIVHKSTAVFVEKRLPDTAESYEKKKPEQSKVMLQEPPSSATREILRTCLQLHPFLELLYLVHQNLIVRHVTVLMMCSAIRFVCDKHICSDSMQFIVYLTA